MTMLWQSSLDSWCFSVPDCSSSSFTYFTAYKFNLVQPDLGEYNSACTWLIWLCREGNPNSWTKWCFGVCPWTPSLYCCKVPMGCVNHSVPRLLWLGGKLSEHGSGCYIWIETIPTSSPDSILYLSIYHLWIHSKTRKDIQYWQSNM